MKKAKRTNNINKAIRQASQSQYMNRHEGAC